MPERIDTAKATPEENTAALHRWADYLNPYLTRLVLGFIQTLILGK